MMGAESALLLLLTFFYSCYNAPVYHKSAQIDIESYQYSTVKMHLLLLM